MKEDLDYDATEILLFDYSGITPLSSPLETYAQTDTLISIDGQSGSASKLRALINDQAGPGEQFDIVAHSQGGVVSLFAALDFSAQAGPPVTGKIHSIVTISSPVKGIDTVRFLGSGLFTCAGPAHPSILDMFPHNPLNPDEVIERIGRQNWVGNNNPFVVTVANTKDPVISDAIPSDGVRGVLDAAHEQVLEYLGGDLFSAHNITLNIISNSAAIPVENKLLRSLIEYQLQELFLTGNSYLRPALSRANIITLDTWTRTFMGNRDANLHPALGPPPLNFGPPLVLLGSHDAVILHPVLSRALIETPNTFTRAFIGNRDANLHPALGPPSFSFGPPLVLLGSHDAVILHPVLSRALIETPDTFTRAFMGNRDANSHPALAPRPLSFGPALVLLGSHDAVILHPALSRALIETPNTFTRTFMGNQDAMIHPELCCADVIGNAVPIADDAFVSTDQNTPVAIQLTGSDADSGDMLSFTIGSLPGSGDLEEMGTPIDLVPHPLFGDTVTYIPNSISGNDSFTFTATDGKAVSAPATVAITINPPSTRPDVFLYAAKIICVPHFGPASPALMPGKYRTAVNVHNPWDQPAHIEKWVTLSPPQGQPPVTGDKISGTVQPWASFDVACPYFRDEFGLPEGAKVPGGKGFMVIQSDRELDVVAVYTSRTETPNSNGVGTSIDVERVEPKIRQSTSPP